MEKLSAYECGLEPVGDARIQFDILYYVIGIFYLIFDLEIIFLFPLATVLFSLGSIYAVWVVMIFLIILTIGFLYEWFHGTWNYGIHVAANLAALKAFLINRVGDWALTLGILLTIGLISDLSLARLLGVTGVTGLVQWLEFWFWEPAI